MRIRVHTESMPARAASALQDDMSYEVDTVIRQASDTKVTRSRRSNYRRFSEPQSVASLAEQDPYYMARARALHGSCLCCGTSIAPPRRRQPLIR
jgi:hypothetical protein